MTMGERQQRAWPTTWMQTDLGFDFFWDVRKTLDRRPTRRIDARTGSGVASR